MSLEPLFRMASRMMMNNYSDGEGVGGRGEVTGGGDDDMVPNKFYKNINNSLKNFLYRN